MNRADKIILHGLWDYQVLLLLTAQPWLLQKCYWTIWGGDLYVRHAKTKVGVSIWRQHVGEAIRRIVIRRLGHCVTYIKADYELARQWHGAKGQWHDCLIYPSNLYRELPTQNADHVGINILVGNSAYTSNDHKEVLDRLMPYAQENIKIYCPLSYGDEAYAREVSEYGKAMYGSKFVALLKYMPLDEYLQLLAKMDIAIFNHKRQQGMGNITTLLGTGKKVYLRQEVTPYFMFKNLGVQVLPVDEFDLERIAPDVSRLNSERIKQYFSSDRLATQWRQIVSSGISE